MKMKNKKVLKSVKILEITALLLALASFASVKTDEPEAITGAKEKYYVLSVYDDRVAVFENGSDTPSEVFDTYISSLPYTEQTELINGIRVSGRHELQKIIEDYTS